MTSTLSKVRRIVIIGGGTAGWMSAALLAQLSQGKIADITLVESDEIGTVGVGEATIPAIKRFNRLLNVVEKDFMIQTEASFKLGIEFVNWGKLGTSYIHPFGSIGAPIGRAAFHHFLTRRRLAGIDESFEDYSMNCLAAKQNRFVPPPNDGSLLSQLSYAYHFDAALYAKFLRRRAESNGVRRAEGKIVNVKQNSENGFIQSVRLDNGIEIQGDFFIDCSGFKGLLIEETLKSGYEDWSKFLPCDRATFAPSALIDEIPPYTRSTAHTAGWQWRIPLQHRTGNGHVYSSGFMDDNTAADILVQNLNGAPLADPRFIKFTTGRRKLFWNRNVVAIGLAGGFLEPLESTSIHLIQSGLVKLFDFWPDAQFSPLLSAQYNKAMLNQYESIRDFIILHYKATERNDSPFWDYCRTMDVPESLMDKMDHFRAASRIVLTPGELFQPDSWLAVMLGQHIVPSSYDPFADVIDQEEMDTKFDMMRTAISRTVQTIPTHRAILQSMR